MEGEPVMDDIDRDTLLREKTSRTTREIFNLASLWEMMGLHLKMMQTKKYTIKDGVSKSTKKRVDQIYWEPSCKVNVGEPV